MEDRRPQFVEAVQPVRGPHRRPGRRRSLDAAIDRLVWYAGWADKITQVVGGANPVAGPFFNLSTPEPTGVVAVLAPAGVVACSAWSAWSPRSIVTGNTRRGDQLLRAAAARGHVRRGARHLRRARRRGQHPHRRIGHHRARGWPPTWTSTRIDLTGAAGDAETATALEVAAAENLKRVRRAPAAEPDWTADPGLDRMTAVPRDQDRLAPDRHLSRGSPGSSCSPAPPGPASPASPNGSGCRCCGSTTSTRTARDPTLPAITEGPNAGLVDWDHPASWLPDDAVRTLEQLCREGRADVPVYDIAQDGRCGWQVLDLGDAPLLRGGGHLRPGRGRPPARTAACSRRRTACASTRCVTFWRRLTRDLREHRKPPLVLLRRGYALLRDQRRVVADAVAKGCTPVTPDEAFHQVTDLVEGRLMDPRLAAATLRQPDATQLRGGGAGDGAQHQRPGVRRAAGHRRAPDHRAPPARHHAGALRRRGAGDAPPHHQPGRRPRRRPAALAAEVRHAAVGGRPPAQRLHRHAVAGEGDHPVGPLRRARGRSGPPPRRDRSRCTSAAAGCRGTWCWSSTPTCGSTSRRRGASSPSPPTTSPAPR